MRVNNLTYSHLSAVLKHAVSKARKGIKQRMMSLSTAHGLKALVITLNTNDGRNSWEAYSVVGGLAVAPEVVLGEWLFAKKIEERNSLANGTQVAEAIGARAAREAACFLSPLERRRALSL